MIKMKLLTALLALTTSFAASAIMPDQVRFCQAQGSYAEQAFVSRSTGVTQPDAESLVINAGVNESAKTMALTIIDTVYKMDMPEKPEDIAIKAKGAGMAMTKICIKVFEGEK